MEPAIAPIVPGDIPEMVALWKDVEGMVLREADSPAALTRFLDRNPGMSLCARCDGRLVGVALCGHDGRRGYLHHVAVAADMRRRGIARALVERCLSSLAGLGIDKCQLFVHTGNEPARAFWMHLGWHPRDDVRLMSFVQAGKPNA